MQRPFAITPSVPSLSLDPQRRGEVLFTVSNDLAEPVRAKASVVIDPADTSDVSWATVAQPEFDLELQGTAGIRVAIEVPRHIEPGGFELRLVVADREHPDQIYSESAPVGFRVTTPAVKERAPFPWWIVFLAGGILALAALITAVVVLWPERDPDDFVLGAAVAPAAIQIPQGQSQTVELTLTRGDKLKQAAEVTASDLPDGVTVDPLTIRRKGLTGTVVLNAASDAPLVADHPITLAASAGDSQATAGLTVGVVPPPLGLVAAFTAAPMEGPIPLEVAFTDQSNDAVRWAWKFGDGITSAEQNPTHTYADPGTYAVELKVYSEGNEVAEIKKTVRAEKRPLVAKFVPSHTVGTAPLQVRFTDQSKEATSWRYEFGDGQTSTTPNPVYTFGKPGTYPVTLTVTNLEGSDRFAQTITVQGSKMRAVIAARPSRGAAALQVQLQGSVTGGTAKTYQWKLGDGGTNTGSGTSRTYSFPGSYQVELTATDAYGNASTTSQRIDVGPPAWSCYWTGWFSEESGGTKACSGGDAVNGMQCSGSYCDNKRLHCCKYLPGSDNKANGQWTRGSYSEEGGRNQSFGGILGAVKCSGSYCDNLQFLWLSPTGVPVNTGQCSWTGWFSEENGGYGTCPANKFVRGVACNGKYCDNLRLQCCPVRYTRR